MTKHFLIFGFLTVTLTVIGQETADTIYDKKVEILRTGFPFPNAILDTFFLDEAGQNINRDKAYQYMIYEIKDSSGFDTKMYYMDGTLKAKASYKSLHPLIKEGLFQYYDEDGHLYNQGYYKADSLDGRWETFDTNGKVTMIEHYKNGKLHGDFITFHENGAIRRKELYNYNKFISGNCYTREGTDTSFYPYEIIATFKGGEKAFYKYLVDNIKYPSKARRLSITGKVYIKFLITEHGKVQSARVIRSVHPLLDKEALRVIRNMPDWIPGQIEGEFVKVYYQLPVVFQLED